MTHNPTPLRRAPRMRTTLASAVLMAVLAGPASAAVMISQVYGGGGNGGARFNHDYVELFNSGAAPVNLTGYTLRYASAAGMSWTSNAVLSGNIPAGGYYLVRLSSNNVAVGSPLPVTPDATGSISMSATAGKLALFNDATVPIVACPLPSASIVDFVGFGAAANCSETAPAPAPSNTTAIFRRNAGTNSCQDSGNNGADFMAAAPVPRSSATPAQACDGSGGGGPDPDPIPGTPASIMAIQGSGATSPLAGQTVITSGVVTRINSNGFFIQDAAGDGNPATSDGLFVFTGSTTFPAVVVGNLVQVTGAVAEFSNGAGTAATPLTQIANPSAVTLTGSGAAIVPAVISLPLAVGDSLERFEGMLVQINTTLTVQQNFFQARFGQITLGAGGRHENPTNRFRPGPQAVELADLQGRGRLLLDDGSSLQNPRPTPYFSGGILPRAGDTVSGLTGVLDFGLATASAGSFGLYRLHPTAMPAFVASNPRPPAPPAVGGNMRVAAMNVLNYFTTFTNGQTASGQVGQGCTLGASTSAGNCRGANNIDEFQRQQAKIVRALAGLNADAVGLMEIQNSAVATDNLVAALNAFVGSNTWAAVADPDFMGTDAIKLAILYKPARLGLVGAAMSDADPVNNRPTLAQTFQAANGERFSLVVNHLKSKGSCPSGSPVTNPDADQGDGQGCWNATRLAQAERLKTWVGTVQTAGGTTDSLIVGDLNSYGREDPIFALTSAGWVDQLLRFSPFAYTYIFDGVSGRLDHAIASSTLSPKVTFARAWQINADEQVAHDYNLEFKAPAVTCGGLLCPADPYDGTTPYRSSDHDPALMGLNIYKTINGTASADTLMGSPGDDILTGGPGADRTTGGAGADLFAFNSVLDGGDTITDFSVGSDKIVVRNVLRSIGRAALANPIASGHITCSAGRGGAVVGIDSDGSAGPQPSRVLVLLQGQNCLAVMNLQNFMY